MEPLPQWFNDTHGRDRSGPLPPRYGQRQPNWREHKTMQTVWPRDKKNSTWGRWKDIFTGKGPDIWVSKRSSDGPHKPVWSGWKRGPTNGWWDNLGYRYMKRNETYPPSWARRPVDERYDFQARKYRDCHRPDIRSDVKWSNGKRPVPLYWSDRFGNEYRNINVEVPGYPLWRNPYRYRRRTKRWDWHNDLIAY